MIIDVSHLSEGGFFDVSRCSRKPFVASHSCAKALCSHSRNLTDEQLRAISNSGGVAGVNFYAAFLREDARATYIKDIVRHVKYMLNVMGEDHVAFGSDFDGFRCEMEIADYSLFGRLRDALSQELSSRVLEKIMYKNVLRVMRDTLCTGENNLNFI